jgi:hypothetical protein
MTETKKDIRQKYSKTLRQQDIKAVRQHRQRKT